MKTLLAIIIITTAFGCGTEPNDTGADADMIDAGATDAGAVDSNSDAAHATCDVFDQDCPGDQFCAWLSADRSGQCLEFNLLWGTADVGVTCSGHPDCMPTLGCFNPNVFSIGAATGITTGVCGQLCEAINTTTGCGASEICAAIPDIADVGVCVPNL
jgi:hypothetical protein